LCKFSSPPPHPNFHIVFHSLPYHRSRLFLCYVHIYVISNIFDNERALSV
jgi:hypothetical protein